MDGSHGSQQLVKQAPALIKLTNIGNSRTATALYYSGPNVLTFWLSMSNLSLSHEHVHIWLCKTAKASLLSIMQDVCVIVKSNHIIPRTMLLVPAGTVNFNPVWWLYMFIIRFLVLVHPPPQWVAKILQLTRYHTKDMDSKRARLLDDILNNNNGCV